MILQGNKVYVEQILRTIDFFFSKENLFQSVFFLRKLDKRNKSLCFQMHLKYIEFKIRKHHFCHHFHKNERSLRLLFARIFTSVGIKKIIKVSKTTLLP